MSNLTEKVFNETSPENGPHSSLWITMNNVTDAYFDETTPENRQQTKVRTDAKISEQATVEFGNSTFSVFHTTFDSSTHDSNADGYNDYANYENDYDYDEYMYPGYGFERPMYLYIWEILVIVTSLVNMVVIFVLLRRRMRNPTNIVLATIAITDSLTGLITLPTYIMVFLRFEPVEPYTETDYVYNNLYDRNTTTPPVYENIEPVDGYCLSKNLCRGFMISKYFLSKSFHTMSIFLTLFLGIQRYISIAYPYKSQLLLNLKRTIIVCVIIVVVSPLLHTYHLVGEKAVDGLCQWELKDKHCGAGCIYLWIAFFIRHFLPCVALVTFTAMFICQLRVGERTLRRMESNKSQLSRRSDENRRISLIVTAVVVVFLIPEVPYGIFLLYNAVDKTVNQGQGIRLEANRAIHMVYELFLVLSFHANFYIYTLFNRRFRKTLNRTFIKPIRRLLGDPNRLSFSRSSTTSHKPSNRKTDTGSTKNKFELETMITSKPDQFTAVEEKIVTSTFIEKDAGSDNIDTNKFHNSVL